MEDINVMYMHKDDNGVVSIGYTQKVFCKQISIHSMHYGKKTQDKILEETKPDYHDIYFMKPIANAKLNTETNEIMLKLDDLVK